MPLFYRPPRTFFVGESFEYSQGWPGTFNEINPQFLTASVSDGFEFSNNWPGTFQQINPQFLTASVSDGFEPSDGWT